VNDDSGPIPLAELKPGVVAYLGTMDLEDWDDGAEDPDTGVVVIRDDGGVLRLVHLTGASCSDENRVKAWRLDADERLYRTQAAAVRAALAEDREYYREALLNLEAVERWLGRQVTPPPPA
jgi:hypothetical protein